MLFYTEGQLDASLLLLSLEWHQRAIFPSWVCFKWGMREWDKQHEPYFYYDNNLVLTMKMYTAWKKTNLFLERN